MLLSTCGKTKPREQRLIDRGFIEVIGSCTFLEELSGIARGNPILYLEMLREYSQMTHEKILTYANMVVQIEGEKSQSCELEACLLDKDETESLLNSLMDPNEAVNAFNEVYSMKNGYKFSMDKTSQEVRTTLRSHYATNLEIIEGYRSWFRDIATNANNFFKDIFNKSDSVSYVTYPHVASFLDFSLTRIYEGLALGIPTKPSDLHDRAHFVDATVVDFLITDDSDFLNTCSRIPNKPCDLMRFKDFVKCLNYWQAANRLCKS